MRIALVIAMVGMCGCTTLEAPVSAYRVGRIAAITYLSTESNPARQRAVREAWLVYNDFVGTYADNPQAVTATLKHILSRRLPDNAEYVLAALAVDTLWNELNNNYNLEEMRPNELINILREFRFGVNSVIEEYSR